MSTLLSTHHWAHQHGKPLGQAQFKAHAQDFIVTEELGFEPSGAGEHIFLWIEKCNLNTAFVAEQLAKFSQLPLRDVTYAGRKDKYAITRQWFGLYLANKKEPDWSKLNIQGVTLLSQTRNDRKLRTGVLKSNRFEVTLRGIENTKQQAIEKRLAQIVKHGVPNYYGEQRFGQIRTNMSDINSANSVIETDSSHTNSQTSARIEALLPGNLALANKMIDGEEIRNRNKRSMAISALRSWLFNEFIHRRMLQQDITQPISGDAMQLAGSNSFFVADEIDDDINMRLAKQDIYITAPLWGKGFVHTNGKAGELEKSNASQFKVQCDFLSKLGLKQERRAVSVFPTQLKWALADNILNISFELPAGCFATSVLRELFVLRE